jgi:hypothetical protein
VELDPNDFVEASNQTASAANLDAFVIDDEEESKDSNPYKQRLHLEKESLEEPSASTVEEKKPEKDQPKQKTKRANLFTNDGMRRGFTFSNPFRSSTETESTKKAPKV